jgi:hypothetical protein
MAVNSHHPSYDARLKDWQACRDVYEGQSAVVCREDGKRYLPPTTGQLIDMKERPDIGQKNYCAYRDRALLSGFFSDAIDMFMGLLWHRPTMFELGPLESIFGENRPATGTGESLAQLLRRMHVEAMTTGRLGLLGDLPAEESATPQPYIELYETEQIVNWNDGVRELGRAKLNLVVLDESASEMQLDLSWQPKCYHRVLWLGSLAGLESSGSYSVARFEGTEAFDPSKALRPAVLQRPLDEIPFVFVSTKSLTMRIEPPPLISLARAVLALYRMDADYRQHIHSCGQDTLVTSGAAEDEVKSVGAGAHIPLANPDAKAYFIGINSQGLAETRQAIENDRVLCQKKAGELLADNSKQRQSGDALAEMTGRKGASLMDIALMCAEGLQRMLRILAKWLGASPTEIETIKVIPNTKFGTPTFASAEMKALVEAYVLGAPITLKSIHEYNVAHGYTNLTWDDMIAEKRDEAELLADLMPMPPPAPNDGEGDDNSDDSKEEDDAAA